MSPTDSVQPDTIFATPFRARSDAIRTYSHRRGSNTDTRLLPQLKPQTPAIRPRPRLSQTNGSLFSPTGATLVSDDNDPSSQDLNTPDVLDANTREPEHEIENNVSNHAFDNYEDIYNPEESDMESQQNSRDVPPATEISDTDPDLDTSDDGDEHPSTRDARPRDTPYQSTSRPPAPAPSRAKSIRRRPFLIFDKTPKKLTSFKKLKRDMTKTSYVPGDGFSDSEARPKGFLQLTKKRKLHFSVPAVGVLDLTQAPPLPTKPSPANQPKEPRIIRKRKKRVHDNSFLPDTPKKARRERRHEQDAKKKPDTQPTVISGLSAQYGQVVSNLVPGESSTDEPVAGLPPNAGETTATQDTNCAKNDTVEQSLPPPVNVNINGQVVENDIISVEFSDLPLNIKKEGNTYQENVYIPETSPPRSMSLQLNPPTVEDKAEETVQSSRRVFRRTKSG